MAKCDYWIDLVLAINYQIDWTTLHLKLLPFNLSFRLSYISLTKKTLIMSRAIVVTNGMLDTFYAKTCHGLLRGTKRYDIVAVIDYKHAGKDAGEVLFNRRNEIPIFSSVQDFVKKSKTNAEYCIVGVAFEGGILPDSFKGGLAVAIRNRMSIVNGLHTYLSDDEVFQQMANQYSVKLIDIRKPKKIKDLSFWSGKILNMKTPRIAVLGMDCAVGKRTTTRWLWQRCENADIRTEMIYTGQTGWLQGHKYGFIFDSTLNDFVSGELENALLKCDQEEQPDLMIIEGQSSLRNPTGPCGSEIIISGGVKHVILQHQPSRIYFDDNEEWKIPIPSLQSEIDLIQKLGAEVIAVVMNPDGLKAPQETLSKLKKSLPIPIFNGESEQMDPIVALIKKKVLSPSAS